MINIEPIAKEKMIQDAVHSFPDECCGFLYGTEDAQGNRTVSEILVVHNAKEGDKRRRFEISPKDYLQAELFADEHNLQLLGVYHSHPNHPAIPSEQDRVAAQPYFSYVILSIYDKEMKGLRSWRLNDAFEFEEEIINEHEHINQ
ncbi:MAG TPA: M67 family metallopeptidase [Chitinophagaceae bacterium]|nr:M67 family metallopeptidase [Chitinophagaceae bacterium]